MKGLTLYALIGCFVLFFDGSNAQSTSSQPPGYYAGYLNRYTKEDQCVYSFVVPKKDRDQCPGLKSTVEAMSEKLEELEKKQNDITALVGALKDNKESWRRIGELQTMVQQLERDKSQVIADATTLKAEKEAAEERQFQLTADLEGERSQHQSLQAKYIPLQGNYTQLLDDFKRMREEMEKLQKEYEVEKSSVKTLRKAKNCTEISKHLPSCAAIKRMGYTESGPSMIDPDGQGGIEPFMVYCDMISDPSTGITVIEHNHLKDTPVVGCEEKGCRKQPIKYKGVRMEQIVKLMKLSVACEQHIRYDCYDSKLLKDGTGWWISRGGKRMNYWGGATPGNNMCACGEKGNCVDKNEVCNCDADSESWLYDEGFLRDKHYLPVSELRFGDVSEENGERGKSTLGPLRCKWDIGYPVPSCDALEKAGVTASGDYMILQGDRKSPEKLRCNFAYAQSGSNVITPRPDITEHASALTPHGNRNLYLFTDCGQNHGRFGPTEAMCNHTYKDTNVRVTVKDGTQFWKVPESGRYKIEAKGPAGQQYIQRYAGRGATISAEFDFKQNVTIKIIVGQKGTRFPDREYYGGSGGTFVVEFVSYVDQPLLVAGGGGCGATKTGNARLKVTDASTTADGKDGSEVGVNYGRGGKDGDGGERGGAPAGWNTPGGGAGFMRDGMPSGEERWGEVEPAIRFTSHDRGNDAPGVGGLFTDSVNRELNGGFGGGGSAASHASGGAGGYSGGGGGPDEGYSGGGGSYVFASRGRSVNIESNNSGPGEVRIEYLGPINT